MRARSIAVALTGLGALASCPLAHARTLPDRDLTAPSSEASPAALQLLDAAAVASREQVWVATQRVLSVAGGATQVSSRPVMHPAGADPQDAELLMLLAGHYDLVLGRDGASTVIEVRRPGVVGPSGRAARFWVDRTTGMVVRRDVFDEQGALLRRTELLGVRIAPLVLATVGAAQPDGAHLDEVALADLQQRGWYVPSWLPGDLELYDARQLDHGVIQLAYSDGLSTLSLFAQRGERPPSASGVVRAIGGAQVWISDSEPERMVWTADGCTWTLVSDADPQLIDEVVAAMPHHGRPAAQAGLMTRLWRGLNRVGSWLNPFG